MTDISPVLEPIQNILASLEELQQQIDGAPEGIREHAGKLLDDLNRQRHQIENIKTALEMAGQPDDVRVQAAAELIGEMCCWCVSDLLSYRDQLIRPALEVVLMDQPERIDGVTLWKETFNTALELIKDAEEQAELRLELHEALLMADHDRAILGLPATGQLTREQIAKATAAAETAAGLSKNGRPFSRFRNAQQRLLLVLANEPAAAIQG
jgi:hypothetical protein